ncbi:MAG TPA: DUF4465 domain-containing protein [Phycisphaerae bacterium]|nr:DUF4465 domain-containing protein [Phycisphaerae bacterium]
MRATQWMAMAVGAWLAVSGGATAENVANFDDLPLGPDDYWNGSADPAAGGFATGAAFFNNIYVIDPFSGWAFWGGWSYSNMTDTTTPGYQNQFSAITGGAHSGANYAVAYLDTWYGVTPTVTWPQAAVLGAAYFTNTTYAYLDMLNGSPYSKKFGGSTGSDTDWFLLTILGKDGQGNPTGAVEFYLADFRFEDPAEDYIVDQWTRVDLSPLGEVWSVEFALSSSDLDLWDRMNTPAYFAMDSFVMPEPATLGLLAAGVAGLWMRRRRR